jgi:hypothetical protein
MREIAIVGSPEARRPLFDVVWGRFRPDTVVAVGHETGSDVPLLRGRPAADRGARAYVCREFVCDLPADTAAELAAQLGDG